MRYKFTLKPKVLYFQSNVIRINISIDIIIITADNMYMSIFTKRNENNENGETTMTRYYTEHNATQVIFNTEMDRKEFIDALEQIPSVPQYDVKPIPYNDTWFLYVACVTKQETEQVKQLSQEFSSRIFTRCIYDFDAKEFVAWIYTQKFIDMIEECEQMNDSDSDKRYAEYIDEMYSTENVKVVVTCDDEGSSMRFIPKS